MRAGEEGGEGREVEGGEMFDFQECGRSSSQDVVSGRGLARDLAEEKKVPESLTGFLWRNRDHFWDVPGGLISRGTKGLESD